MIPEPTREPTGESRVTTMRTEMEEAGPRPGAWPERSHILGGMDVARAEVTHPPGQGPTSLSTSFPSAHPHTPRESLWMAWVRPKVKIPELLPVTGYSENRRAVGSGHFWLEKGQLLPCSRADMHALEAGAPECTCCCEQVRPCQAAHRTLYADLSGFVRWHLLTASGKHHELRSSGNPRTLETGSGCT